MKKASMIGIVAGAIVSLFLAGVMAATGGSVSQTQHSADVQGSTWILTTWSDSSPLPDRPITLQIDQSRVSGTSSCNRYTGPVTMGDTEFHVGVVATTQIFCLDTMDAEDIYLHLLSTATNWRTDGADLVLTASDGEVLLRYSA
ncbi:MAG: META domain-containing protein [Propionibacteriaceae bacterium]|nr:META domain-containing protein [Propionibacteriaceae bacterium]